MRRQWRGANVARRLGRRLRRRWHWRWRPIAAVDDGYALGVELLRNRRRRGLERRFHVARRVVARRRRHILDLLGNRRRRGVMVGRGRQSLWPRLAIASPP